MGLVKGLFRARDGHELVLEENRTELNQTIIKIYNNRTKLFVFKIEPNS
jgi:hypothetical protein